MNVFLWGLCRREIIETGAGFGAALVKHYP